jgi:hypothetical protein
MAEKPNASARIRPEEKSITAFSKAQARAAFLWHRLYIRMYQQLNSRK